MASPTTRARFSRRAHHGLDPQARRHLWEIVAKIKAENKTIVLTTHYMEEAADPL